MAYMIAGVELGEDYVEPQQVPPSGGGSGSGITQADVKQWGNAASAVGLTVAQFLQQMGMGSRPQQPAPQTSGLSAYALPILAVGAVAAVAIFARKK